MSWDETAADARPAGNGKRRVITRDLPIFPKRYTVAAHKIRAVDSTLLMPSSVTPDDVRRMEILISDGCTLHQLAEQDGITWAAARQWLRRLFLKLGWARPRAGRPNTPSQDPSETLRSNWKSRFGELRPDLARPN